MFIVHSNFVFLFPTEAPLKNPVIYCCNSTDSALFSLWRWPWPSIVISLYSFYLFCVVNRNFTIQCSNKPDIYIGANEMNKFFRFVYVCKLVSCLLLLNHVIYIGKGGVFKFVSVFLHSFVTISSTLQLKTIPRDLKLLAFHLRS